MLVRSDAFRDVDRLFAQLMGGTTAGSGPASMPADAWREGDAFFLALDLPGVAADSIDLDVDRNVLSVRAERRVEHESPLLAERWSGTFSRQFILGDMLDLDDIRASYEGGVLTLRIPVAERAKPRKITVNSEHGLSSGEHAEGGGRVLEGTAT